MIITCRLCDSKAEYHGYCLACWLREGKEKMLTALKLIRDKVKCETRWYKKFWRI